MIILVKILTDAKQKLLWKKGSTYIKKNLKEKHKMSDKRKWSEVESRSQFSVLPWNSQGDTCSSTKGQPCKIVVNIGVII